MDQVDHWDHKPPWRTRSVQDHLAPPSDLFLLLAAGLGEPLSVRQYIPLWT